jgi:predicted amidohydrolase
MSAPERVTAAVVQMTSTTEVERNLAAAESLVTRAAERGARLVALPENFAFLRSEGQPVPEAVPGDPRVRNTSVLIGPDGRTIAVYRKIHLFDVDLQGMEHLKESKAVVPGDEVVVADTPAGRLGLSICYDVRFPELYRELSRRGARVLCVPSAFTERTGKAHWEVLLRARAIENLAYVMAPAQVGHHGGGRTSHGQALIVDPWGAVVSQVPDGEGIALAELDFARLERLRRELPALGHARLLGGLGAVRP